MKPLPVAENEIHLPARPAPIHPVLEWLLRYLSIIGLCFWMGGFTFYAGVVIHVGHHVFDSHREVGFLTQQVTVCLNRSGVAVLLILSANHLFSPRSASRPLKHVRFTTLALMAAIQV